MDPKILRIETAVAKAVARYLEYPDEDAAPDIGDALARLLGWNWETRGLLPPMTFEALDRLIIKAIPPGEVSVVGLMAPLVTQVVEWFSAEVRLAPGHEAVDAYVLRYGVKGVPPAPIEAMDRLWSQGVIESAPAWNWVHEFERADAVRS